jgi:hypothetical protein
MRKIILRSSLMAILVLGVWAVTIPAASAQVAVGISVGFGPPAIPVYDQPECPGDGYYWTPGYWAWDADVADYYWVPGTWVEPPDAGLLWTPGYWGWQDAGFVWTDGYWGPTIGFYGGINYGFGYFGDGFVGGRWDAGHFYYNTAVWHVNRTVVRNVYVNKVTIVNNNRVSFNGGNGGISARATAQQEAARNERHVEAEQSQRQQRDDARSNQALRASANHGKPPIAATDRVGAFNGRVEKAKEAGGTYNPPANRAAAAGANARAENNARTDNNGRTENNATNNANAERNETRTNNETERTNNPPNAMTNNRPAASNNTYVHPKDMPAYQKPAAPNTGNAKLDQKYQQQQNKLEQQQDKQRQQLESRQDKEHQQYQKQQANDARNQALEQKHTQQTQQLQQRQQAAQQHLQQRQAPPAHAAPSGGHAAPSEPKQK